MEFFQENTFLYNVTAGILVLVLFLLILKFVESLAKTLFIFLGVLIVGYGLIRFFPNVTEPVARFIGFGWADDEENHTGTDDAQQGSGTAHSVGTDDEGTKGPDDGGSTYDNINTYRDTDVSDDSSTYPDRDGPYENGVGEEGNTHDKGDTYDEIDSYH